MKKTSGMLLILASILLYSSEPLKLVPAGMEQHFVTPGKAALFQFHTDAENPPGRLTGQLFDFTGKRFAAAEFTLQPNRKSYSGTITFPAGFFELSFPAAGGVRFGILSLPDNSGSRDLFWGINLNAKPGVESMFRILHRFGIQSVRRWHSWEYEERSPGCWSANEEKGYDFAGRNGMSILIYNNRVPIWMRAPSERKRMDALPASALQLSPSIETMLARRRQVMGAYQLRNEPDLKSRSGDLYQPYFAANSYLAGRENPDLPVVGPGFGSFFGTIDAPRWRIYLENGLLETIDIFAFHNYTAPETLWPHIRQIRDIFADSPRAALPLWITECGKPWSRGFYNLKDIYRGPSAPRAKVKEDLRSAHWIVAKACLARAAGIDRFFVFILNFHPERTANFGLLDRNNTPHRSLGAYFYAAQLLAGKTYLGDTRSCPDGAERILVFSDGRHHTGVILGRDETPVQLPAPEFPVLDQFAIDGSPLSPDKAGRTLLRGINYLTLSELPPLNRETEGAKLLAIARSYRPLPRKQNPVIFQFDPAGLPANRLGYQARPERLVFSAVNLSEKEQKISPHLQLPPGGKILSSPKVPQILVPRSATSLEYQLDLAEVKNPGNFRIRLEDSSGTGNFLVLPFFLPFENTLAKSFETGNVKRWRPHCSGSMTISDDPTEKAIRIHADFTGINENHWAEPVYRFSSPGENLTGSLGVSFEIRAKQSNGSKYFTYQVVGFHDENNRNITVHFTPAPTEQWQTRTVLWPSFLKLEQLKEFRIGLGPSDNKLDYWIRNIRFLYPDKQ